MVMKKHQTVHISIVSRSNLVRKTCRIEPISDKQQNGNIPPLSNTNPKIQPSPAASLRIRNDQSILLHQTLSMIRIYHLRIVQTTTVSTVTTASVTIQAPRQSTCSTTTTTARPVVAITQTGDAIVGICNTIAGGSTGGSAVYYPAAENASNAIDGLTSTKYTNFGNPSAGCSGSSAGGLDTGFYVIPNISDSSIAVALLFATANDSPNRDPITVTLEGTNLTSTAAFNSGSSWTLIYSGPTGIDSSVDPGRFTYVPQQTFSNTIAFSSYRLLVTSKRGNNTSIQYSEAQIMGYI